MKLVRNIITNHIDEFENFQYYYKILELIESNIDSYPDISIESCKSLFEGVSKTILVELNTSLTSAKMESLSIQQLVKELFKALKNHTTLEELNYISVFVKEIGVVRNLRGEISHGRLSPKEIESEISFAKMISNTTDVFVHYLLDIYFNLEKVSKEKYQYEEYEEFNDWLDEQDHAGFLKSYSLTLYQTDYIRYEQELLNFYPEQE